MNQKRKGETGEPTNNTGEFASKQYDEPKDSALSTGAATIYTDDYGNVTKEQLEVYRAHNVAPADHEDLLDRYGYGNHEAMIQAVKRNSPDGMFDSLKMWKESDGPPPDPILDRWPAQPTKVPKSVLRRVLPTKASDDPISVFRYEGQDFWTNRFVLLDTETIAPYAQNLDVPEQGVTSLKLKGQSLVNETGANLDVDLTKYMDGMAKKNNDWQERVDIKEVETIPSGTVHGVDYDVYDLRLDPEVTVGQEEHRIRVRADYLHLALGTTDLSKVDPEVTVEQAATRHDGHKAYTPLVIKRGARLIGYVMPVRM